MATTPPTTEELVSEEIELPGSSQSQYVIDAANKTRNIFK